MGFELVAAVNLSPRNLHDPELPERVRALLDLLGWVIAGALLFFGLALALGARDRLRAAVVAIILAVATYLAFVKGLGVTLPGGLLSGVI